MHPAAIRTPIIEDLTLLVAAIASRLADYEANTSPTGEPTVGTGNRLGESEDRVFSVIAVEG